MNYLNLIITFKDDKSYELNLPSTYFRIEHGIRSEIISNNGIAYYYEISSNNTADYPLFEQFFSDIVTNEKSLQNITQININDNRGENYQNFVILKDNIENIHFSYIGTDQQPSCVITIFYINNKE